MVYYNILYMSGVEMLAVSLVGISIAANVCVELVNEMRRVEVMRPIVRWLRDLKWRHWRPVDAHTLSTQLLPDDVLYIIGTADWQVYGAMVAVNRTLNAMLRPFDAYAAFTHEVENNYSEARTHYSLTKLTRYSQIRNARHSDNSTILHGDVIGTETELVGTTRWSKRETRRRYRLGREVHVEIYIYRRIRDPITQAYREHRWKSWENIHCAPRRGDKCRYRIERIFNELDQVTQTCHYRDNVLYSPTQESIMYAAIVAIYGGIGIAMCYYTYKCGPTLFARIGARVCRVIRDLI
nr:Hypothetical protein FSTVLC9_428 [Faustovirus]